MTRERNHIAVCHVYGGMQLAGGVEMVLELLLQGLSKKQFLQTLCLLRRLPCGLEKNLDHYQVYPRHRKQVKPILVFKKIKPPILMVRVVEEIRLLSHVISARADILHVHRGCDNSHTVLIMICRILGMRVIRTVHGNPKCYGRSSNLVRLINILCVSVFVCPSPGNVERMRARMKSRRVQVRLLPNGVDIDRYVGLEDSRECLRRELRAGSKYIVISVARLDLREKDHETLIRGFGIFYEKSRDSILLLIGDGPGRSELKTLVEQLGLEGSVRFLGVRRDIPKLLAAADCKVLMSHFEGFGLAVVEAMAAGLPVIASDIDPLNWILDNGKSGVLVDQGDSQALASALWEIRNSETDRGRIIKNARGRALREYSLKEFLLRHERLYMDVMKNVVAYR